MNDVFVTDPNDESFVARRPRPSALEIIHKLQPLLGLQDWRIVIDREPCDDQASASIDCVYGRKVASVHLSRDWVTIEPHVQREALIHELLHCHLHLAETMVDTLVGRLSTDVFCLWQAQFVTAIEFAIDGIALAIAPLVEDRL